MKITIEFSNGEKMNFESDWDGVDIKTENKTATFTFKKNDIEENDRPLQDEIKMHEEEIYPPPSCHKNKNPEQRPVFKVATKKEKIEKEWEQVVNNLKDQTNNAST